MESFWMLLFECLSMPMTGVRGKTGVNGNSRMAVAG